MKINKIIKVLFCLAIFACPTLANADDIDDGNGNGDVLDTPAAPIDGLVPMVIVAATVMGYIVLRKKEVKN